MPTRPLLLILAYLAFVSLGLPDTVIGVAWPTIRSTFGLTQAGMGAVLGASLCGYVSSGLVAGRLSARLGVGGLLAASCGLVALGLAGYATAPAWAVFFPFAVVHGLGSGAIDATLNSYAARHLAVRHLNWLHACWSIGATIGPLVMTGALSRTGSFRAGYGVLAAVLAAMGVAFVLTRRSWDDGADAVDARPAAAPPRSVGAWEALGRGRVWLQIGIFFVYTGVETGAGQWCFTVMREGRGVGLEAAGAWTAAFWGSLLTGRIAVGFVVDRIGADRLLRICTVAVIIGALAFAVDAGLVGRMGLLVLGAALAPSYPTLMARTPARLGPSVTAHAAGFQVSAAALGAVAFPAALGVLATHMGVGAVAPAVAGVALVFVLLHETLVRVTRGA